MEHNVIVNDEGYKGLNPMQFGYQDCPPAHSFGPAARTHYLIHFVVSGFGYFKTGDKEYTLGPGEMFIIRPYEETFYQADTKNPWSYIWIGFTTSDSLPASLSDTIKCPEALSIFNTMKNCEKSETGKSAFLCARLWDLFALLLSREKDTIDYAENALDCIHAEYMNPLTIEEIAHRLNIDRTYLYTVFKRKTGMSPKKYLLDYRLNTAASLMTEKDKSISIAAYSVGYTDIFNFSKMFKRKFGVSPKEYKKAFDKSPACGRRN